MDTNKEGGENKMATRFYESVSAGNIEQVESMLRKVRPDEAAILLESRHGYYKETPLLTATWQKHRALIELLLTHKAAVNAQNHAGRYSLMHACINDDVRTVELLLGHGADVTQTDRCGMSALHFAAKSSATGEAVKILLDAGASVNAQCSASAYTWFFQSIDRDLQTHLFTPLHFAALACNPDTVTLLLKNKANPRLKDGKGRTPLQLLVYHAQHYSGVQHRENYFKTRERLKRPDFDFPPAAKQVVKRDPSPPPAPDPGPQDLKGVRKGLLKVRADLARDYKATSEKLGKDENKSDPGALSAIAKGFENQANNRVTEATDYINAAIDILDEAESASPPDPYNDYTYHRVFNFVAKEIGSKKYQWQDLARALIDPIPDLHTGRVIKAVWAHNTTEVEAAQEILARWKVYTNQQPEPITRLKKVLADVMNMSKTFLLQIDMLCDERLPLKDEKPTEKGIHKKSPTGLDKPSVAIALKRGSNKSQTTRRTDTVTSNLSTNSTNRKNQQQPQKTPRGTIASNKQTAVKKLTNLK